MKSVSVVAVWLCMVAVRFVDGAVGPQQTTGSKCAQKCDTYAECVEVAEGNFTCVCRAGLIGDGLPGRCHDLKEVVKAKCRYQFLPLLYEQVLRKTKQATPNSAKWCEDFHLLEATITNSEWQIEYVGDKLTTADCAMVLQQDIICPDKQAIPAQKFSQSGNPIEQENAVIQGAVNATKEKFIALGKLYNYEALTKMALEHKEMEYIKKDNLASLFNTAKGTPHATRLSMTSEEARRLRTHDRSIASNQFYTEPELSNQASFEIYDQSGWDRGHMIPPQLASFDSWALQNTFSYAFIVPQAPKFNRVHWLQMENALLKHINSVFAESYGEISLLTGTSSKEIKIYDAVNGSKEFSLVEGPVRSLKEKITIPNSMWTLAACVHVDPQTNGIKQVETIAYIGNNYDELSKAITLSIPLDAIREEYGITPLTIPPDVKQTHTFLTKPIPRKT